MAGDRDRWGGRVAFVMAAVGSAVGLGNVWRFPYIAYKSGGGAFIIPYFVALISAGIPLMILEYALGQKFQAGAPKALGTINRGFRWVGWFAILVGLSISFYYIAIMAYSWGYMVDSATLAWTQPTSNRIVFKRSYALYETEEERAALDRKVEEEQIQSMDLVKKGELERARAKVREQWGEDTQLFNSVKDVLAYARRHIEAPEPDQDIKVHVAYLPHELLDEMQTRLEALYKDIEDERRNSEKLDTEITVEESEKLTVIFEHGNAGVYFEEKTLGKFEPAKWQRYKERNDTIDELVGELEEKDTDFSKFDQEFLTSLTPRISKLWSRVQAAAQAVEEATSTPAREEAQWDLETRKEEFAQGLEGCSKDYKGELFTPVGRLVLWAFVTWLLIFLIIFKGVKSVGKVVLFTVPCPIILLGILIVHGLQLDGAGRGIDFFLKPNWEMLKDSKVWLAAYGQIFFSLSLGFGILIAYASYQPRDSDVSNNAFMTSFANCATSFYAAFAVFSVLGYLAVALNQNVDSVVTGGPGLVFVTYPTALAEMGGYAGRIVGILFFLSLITLGIDSAFSIVEAVVTGIHDSFGKVSRTLLCGIVCFLGFCASVVYCTRSGLMWLDIVDNWMSNYGLPIVGLLECIAVGYFFNIGQIRDFVNERSEIKLTSWWDTFIKFVTPAVLLYLLGSVFIDNVMTAYGGYDKVLGCSVKLAGWGYFAVLLLIASLLGRNWLFTLWMLSGLVIALLLSLLMDNFAACAMASLGILLLFGGLLTCIRIAMKGKPTAETGGTP